MPKVYTDQERDDIRKRLKVEARYCLINYGIKRTTVDELVQRVKIPKGTFYLFYKTKELLLFEVLLEEHELIERQLYNEMMKIKGNVTVDNLTEIIYNAYKIIDDSGVLKLLTSGEIELLYRKLPPVVLQTHFSYDSSIIESVVEILSISIPKNIDTFSTAFRNLFITVIYKREAGEDHFDEALKLSIKGLVLQLLEVE